MTIQRRPPPGKYRLTADDFLRLDETGVFATDRTELLDGDIVIRDAEHRPHAWIAGELGYRIRRALEEVGATFTRCRPASRSPTMTCHSRNIVLTSEPRGAGPIPLRSVALVIEVASSTLDRDMRGKPPIYARACVPEYWVADVNGRIIHQMWRPEGEAYAERREGPFGEPITVATVEGITVDTSAL